MSIKLFAKKRDGFTLAEVMVSGFILVLVVASFARASIASFNSLSNVSSRNAAHSIANDKIANLERNPDLIPAITVNEKPPETVNTIERQTGITNTNTAIVKPFNVKIVYTPVAKDGTKLVDVNGNVTLSSKLIRMDVTVSWRDQNATTHNTGQIGFVRK